MSSADWFKKVFPLLQWWPLLNRESAKADIVAGVTGGVLILPQAIALASLAGLPPEYGLYTSMFPVLFAALFGSSWHALSGPNTALCILLAHSIEPYASVGSAEWIQYAITLGFMAGLVQLSIGVLRLGVVFNYFSHAVMVALITGVGIIIIISQLGNFMGVLMNIAEPIENALPQVFYAVERANWFAVAVGSITVLSGLYIKKRKPNWPFMIIAVVVGMLAAYILELVFSPSYVGLDKLGAMSLSALPLSGPDFRPETFSEASEGLIPASIMIALLGLMQASVIARAMANKSGQHVDINQETVGQGIANIAGSFLSCFPGCSSFNRSASNLEAGARTPLSAIVSVIALGALVLFAAPLIRQMPLAVIAGILLLVGMGLIKKEDIKKVMSENRESKIIFLLTLCTTLYGGLDKAVYLGVALSVIAYLRSTSAPHIAVLSGEAAQLYFPRRKPASTGNAGGQSNPVITDESPRDIEHANNVPKRTEDNVIEISIPKRFDHATVVQISGSLFFGSIPRVEAVFNKLAKQDQHKGDLIISGENLHYMDGAGADVLYREVERRISNGARVTLWIRNHSLDQVLESSGLSALLGKENIYYLIRNRRTGTKQSADAHKTNKRISK
jgi:SulP family sulfate permease